VADALQSARGYLQRVGYLSEAARRWIAAAILVVGIAIAALAIANVGPFSNPPTQAQRAEAAVERFFTAGHEKDFKGACKQLTHEAQLTLEQRGGAVAAQKGLKGCDQILGLFLAKLELGKVVDVRVSGNRAVVDASVRQIGAKQGRDTTIDLFLIGDSWKIADFGV
jgi:hypothetical protein